MARRQKYNALMPPGLAGKPMPLRPKLDDRWRKRVLLAGMEDNALCHERYEAASVRIREAMAYSMALLGGEQTALILLNMAEFAAGSPQDGRPKGSRSRHTSSADVRCIDLILKLDDGSRGSRGRAIALAVAKEYPQVQVQEAAKRRLRHKLKALKAGSPTDKK